MDEDRIKGKAKDIAGRVERQAGEWIGDKEAEAEGTRKQESTRVEDSFLPSKSAKGYFDSRDQSACRLSVTSCSEAPQTAFLSRCQPVTFLPRLGFPVSFPSAARPIGRGSSAG